MQVNQVLKVPQVSQDQWAPLDPLAKVVLDILDHQAPLDLPGPQVTLLLGNPEALEPLANPEPTVNLVIEEPLERPVLWAHEEPPGPLEHLDLLDFHLLANLAQLALLEQWDQEESPV